MRLRILVLLPASIVLAASVMLTRASFTVAGWMEPAGESAFAYRHPVAVTAFAALLPWMVAGALVRWRFVMRMPVIFGLFAWTLVAVPVMAITIADERGLHRNHPEILERMRMGRGQMRVPPPRAVDAALAAGDCRPLARPGYAPVVPRVRDLPRSERTVIEPYGYRLVPGTGDVIASAGHRRYGREVYRYSESYNRHLLARLRTPSGRLDPARCDPAYSTRSSLLP